MASDKLTYSFKLFAHPIVGEGGRLGWHYHFEDGSPTCIVQWLDELEGKDPADWWK